MKRIVLAVLLVLCFSVADAGKFIKGSRVGPYSATVAWTIPEDSTTTSQTGTKVYKSIDRVTWILVTTIANTSTVSYNVTGLTGATWNFEVSSYSAAGEGNRSNTGQTKTVP